jgi:excisionase family DNA binding protein
MTTSNGHNPLLTIDETAKLLRLSHATVRRLARSGELPALRFGRQWRVELSELGTAAGRTTHRQGGN